MQRPTLSQTPSAPPERAQVAPTALRADSLQRPLALQRLLLKQAPAAGPQREPPDAKPQLSVQHLASLASLMVEGSQSSPCSSLLSPQASASVTPLGIAGFTRLLERVSVGPDGLRLPLFEGFLVASTPDGIGVSEFENDGTSDASVSVAESDPPPPPPPPDCETPAWPLEDGS